MKTHTFSVVVGDSRCNAKCPFCVAQITASDFSDYVDFDEGRFNIACRIVDQMKDGLLTVLLTGQGEPLLFSKQITRYIDCINFRFPRIELQTNGTLVERNLDNFKYWRDYGLTPCYSSQIGAWIGMNKPEGAAKRLHHYLALNGAVKLLELPHGGVVYDYKDQNVAIGNCLTGTTNPDDIRQVIFFPDGRVSYDWRYKGARLL